MHAAHCVEQDESYGAGVGDGPVDMNVTSAYQIISRGEGTPMRLLSRRREPEPVTSIDSGEMVRCPGSVRGTYLR